MFFLFTNTHEKKIRIHMDTIESYEQIENFVVLSLTNNRKVQVKETLDDVDMALQTIDIADMRGQFGKMLSNILESAQNIQTETTAVVPVKKKEESGLN